MAIVPASRLNHITSKITEVPQTLLSTSPNPKTLKPEPRLPQPSPDTRNKNFKQREVQGFIRLMDKILHDP